MRVFELKLAVLLFAFLNASSSSRVRGECSKGCDLALASYYIWKGSNLTFISKMFDTSIDYIQSFNPQIPNKDLIIAGTRINVPFSCNCIQNQFLGHSFSYKVKHGNTYKKIAKLIYANLTTVDWLERSNIVTVNDENQILDVGSSIDVILNCSCGSKSVSKDYGLFITYPLSPGESLISIAREFELSSELLQSYNPTLDFSSGSGLVFVPGKDQSGNYPPLKRSTGKSSRAIAGISVGGVAGALFMAFCIYAGVYRRKKVAKASFIPETSEDQHGSGSALEKNSESTALFAAPGLTGITVDKSVEFSYEELAKATNDFSMANKIGQGGFGAVFYAELRGEKAAIKKMDMQASKEFLAELKVLTHVHHLNLVRLIGYCVEGSLFLVYEYIENGNLSQHLHGLVSGKDSLPWSTRMQIALDSARGLEYIHEHTVPVYIHRDIKSANILIDKNFRAKVADFGLTKLTEFGSASVHTRLVGTFGYMPPEYAQYGDVSPKMDVYALGVVLYELISAKEAVVKTNETVTESTGLVALVVILSLQCSPLHVSAKLFPLELSSACWFLQFEEVLRQPDPREDLRKLVDQRLGDNYPIDSVRKMAHLARACTQENPQLRPSMRTIVVALMTLSSSTEDWDVGSFYENPGLVSLMSGR